MENTLVSINPINDLWNPNNWEMDIEPLTLATQPSLVQEDLWNAENWELEVNLEPLRKN